MKKKRGRERERKVKGNKKSIGRPKKDKRGGGFKKGEQWEEKREVRGAEVRRREII